MTELIKHTTPERSALEKKPNYALRQAMAISAIGATLALTGLAVGKASEAIADTGYEYSSDTTTYNVKANEGLDAIASYVGGVQDVNQKDVGMHIRSMPENAEAFADGIQVGEMFVIPTHVAK